MHEDDRAAYGRVRVRCRAVSVRVRAVLPLAAEAERTCRLCGDRTHGGKPFCPRHVLHMPYAGRVRRELESRQRLGCHCGEALPPGQRSCSPECADDLAGGWCE